jgi:hypothetical protein
MSRLGYTATGSILRVLPAGADRWWQISSDSDARVVTADMVSQLAAHGWPALTRLLNRHARP